MTLTVEKLAQKCYRDTSHPYEVKKLSLMLFDAVNENLKKINLKYRKILEAAALLHDIGYNIDSKKHNIHSFYMICEKGVDGFTPEGCLLIAHIARYHRGPVPKKKKHEAFAQLSKKERKAVCRLSAILRIADGLDRAHMGLIKSLRAEYDEDNGIFCIYLTSNIIERTPDISWAVRKKDLFEKTFKTQVLFKFD